MKVLGLIPISIFFFLHLIVELAVFQIFWEFPRLLNGHLVFLLVLLVCCNKLLAPIQLQMVLGNLLDLYLANFVT